MPVAYLPHTPGCPTDRTVGVREARPDVHTPSERTADVSVLIVDDQPFFRSAAREVLGAMPGFRALADAASGPEAVSLALELQPDLVLLDIRRPGMDGIEAARRIKAAAPGVVVILISIEDIAGVPSRAQDCGAAALVRKQDFGPSLLRGLWEAHGHAVH